MKAEPFQIKEIHAYLATDKDGVEGVTGLLSNDGVFWPMVCADRARLDSWRDRARQIARATGVTIRVARFSVREDVEIIQP